MGYRTASVGNGRRVGDWSSGPRTVGYDANPHGLAGTGSNIRRMAGSNSTASDYKKNKQKKDNKKKDKEQGKKAEPYPPKEEDLPPEMKKWDPEKNPIPEIDGWDNEVGPGKMKFKAPSSGFGWQLILHTDSKDKELTQIKKEADDTFGVDYGVDPSNWRDIFHIIDVSDKASVKLPTAPLENGMVKNDHKVREPKTLRIRGWVERRNAERVNEVLHAARESKSLEFYFTLTSPMKTYEKMYLKSHTSRASTEKYDVYEYNLELQELLIANTKTYTTYYPGLASNSSQGASQGK